MQKLQMLLQFGLLTVNVFDVYYVLNMITWLCTLVRTVAAK